MHWDVVCFSFCSLMYLTMLLSHWYVDTSLFLTAVVICIAWSHWWHLLLFHWSLNLSYCGSLAHLIAVICTFWILVCWFILSTVFMLMLLWSWSCWVWCIHVSAFHFWYLCMLCFWSPSAYIWLVYVPWTVSFACWIDSGLSVFVIFAHFIVVVESLWFWWHIVHVYTLILVESICTCVESDIDLTLCTRVGEAVHTCIRVYCSHS